MTALQELIQKLESFKTELKEKYDGDPLVTRGISIAIKEANDLLIKESYQIIDAYNVSQERIYSKEEVLEIIDSLFHRYASSFRIDAKEYFLQFKKK